MSFHDTEINVIRHAESSGWLNAGPYDKSFDPVESVSALCDAIAVGEPVAISEQMGRAALDMIVLCALIDIDLSRCIERAYQKIKGEKA